MKYGQVVTIGNVLFWLGSGVSLGACGGSTTPLPDDGDDTMEEETGDGDTGDGDSGDGDGGDGDTGDGDTGDGDVGVGDGDTGDGDTGDGDVGDGDTGDGDVGDGDVGDGDTGDGDTMEPPDDGLGIRSCLPAFKEACTPQINFTNDEPDARGAMFDEVIPDPVATMQDVGCTVCSILFRSPDEIPQDRRHTEINLHVRDNENLADAGGNTIRFDVKHIERYEGNPGAALTEFHGVLVHEAVHLYQHYGNGGLGEGMADFVRIRVGLYEPGRRNAGGNWTDPYTTSGFFFSWLAGPSVYHDDSHAEFDPDIGYLINKTIGEQGPDGVPPLFQERFGTDVDSLWNEYQDAIR